MSKEFYQKEGGKFIKTNLMDKKSVLITGCSSGIGLKTAELLRNNNWSVFATARQEDDLKMLESLNLKPIQLDLNDITSINNCVNFVKSYSEGSLQAIVNNAGYGLPGAIEDLTYDDIKKQFNVNLFGSIELTNQLLPELINQKKSSIVYVSSLVGRMSLPFMGAYSATKFAMEAIADAQRIELSNTPIQVSLIEPGPIYTNFSKNCANNIKHLLKKSSRFNNFYINYFEKRVNGGLIEDRFRLPADKVAKKIVHAVESRAAKSRYKITIPTYIAEILIRFCSTKFRDKIIKKHISKRFS